MPKQIYERLLHKMKRQQINVANSSGEADAEGLITYQLRSRFEVGYLTELGQKNNEDVNNDVGSSDGAMLTNAEFKIAVLNEEIFNWSVQRSLKNGSRCLELLVNGEDFVNELKEWGLNSVADEFDSLVADELGNVRLRCAIRGMLPTRVFIENKDAINEPSGSSVGQKKAIPLPFMMADAQQDLVRTMSMVRYIGPLRAPAKRYYLSSQDASPVNDSTGQATPFTIQSQVNRKVQNRRINAVVETETLGSALNYWVNYLRTGNASPTEIPGAVYTKTTADVLVEILLAGGDGETAHALADSGFGYSQILPILVSILTSPENTTFLIEQPELHLNPSLQVRLADFIAAMIYVGKQLIIETHSEHLVNALRVLIAETDDSYLQENSQLYFISSSTDGPILSTLAIQENGDIPEWPNDFFGESLNLSSRLMRAQKRYITRR